MSALRVAVAVLRYGPDVLGGAESQARGFAEEAARQGWTVEVWTTRARSHYTWENEFREGSERIGGVLVRRFPVELLSLEEHHQAEIAIASRRPLPAAAQFAWLERGAHSPALYRHIAQHAADFDAVVVLPYASPMMQMAAWSAPENVVMWPCLHDEPYAYLEPVRLLLESVWGVMFNSPEEGALAVKQLGIEPQRFAVLGEGVTLPTPPARQPARTDLLYVGRLEGGKNLALLYEFVRRYVQDGGTLRLVVTGKGPAMPPDHPAFDYRGFLSDEEKAEAYASSLALCQPSLNESFSLTVMESWLAGRPALVHGDCAVTRGHVQRSSGGLWFRSYDDFVGAIEWLQGNPDQAAQMGRNGQRYVRENYTWAAVVERFERLVRGWQREAEPVA